MNRQIDTDHKRPIPASAETNIIHAKGERKSGIICNITEPASAIACKVVIRNTPHPISEVIQVAGEAKKEAKYGPFFVADPLLFAEQVLPGNEL